MQTKDRSRHIMGRWYITDFCESILWGWCYFEFLKGTWGKSQDNFVYFWVQLYVLSITFSSQVVLKVTELSESQEKLEIAWECGKVQVLFQMQWTGYVNVREMNVIFGCFEEFLLEWVNMRA